MTDPDIAALVVQLHRHEGERLKPYTDTVGKTTIGVGRNLTDTGISREESDYLLANDIERATDDCDRIFPWFSALDSVRQAALVNLCFNLGIVRLLGFEKALRAMAAGHYAQAAAEFFDSKWARQVGQRAVEVCGQIRTALRQSLIEPLRKVA